MAPGGGNMPGCIGWEKSGPEDATLNPGAMLMPGGSIPGPGITPGGNIDGIGAI